MLALKLLALKISFLNVVDKMDKVSIIYVLFCFIDSLFCICYSFKNVNVQYMSFFLRNNTNMRNTFSAVNVLTMKYTSSKYDSMVLQLEFMQSFIHR